MSKIPPYVPRRAAGSSLYVPGHERQRPTLKPGQSLSSLNCRDLYSEVLHGKSQDLSKLPYNQFDQRTTSYTTEYQDTNPWPAPRTLLGARGHAMTKSCGALRVVPRRGPGPPTLEPSRPLFPVTEYGDPSRSYKAYRFDRSACASPSADCDSLDLLLETRKAISNWSSETATVFPSHTSTDARAPRADPNVHASLPSCLSNPIGTTAYTHQFSDPYALVPSGVAKIPAPVDEQKSGTTKGTCHLPGYRGYIPISLKNYPLQRQAKGEVVRNNEKSMLTANHYHDKLGYGGHKPKHALNDRGGPMILGDLSVTGKMLNEPYRVLVRRGEGEAVKV
uniref:Uncharacterized protein n=1 Tax=Chromera velia CCMP2878 TaxID=1169474 RepID=A0A0G4HJ54_9ALVE|eukprot:Cvel_28133.t1-p1 / transcript=Cvel_28133.t1 / gene=Cvel_28133 / organism=Chromera_velia_CCMP2878 / gene_product=hypothetical protein / transcript_product=hypothetical protein / location=Cvel_scaffold3630:11080-12081(-) / protein_length=334 / sequence_SO=supercontig / SO=protein_coding / is_pseudo=false